MPKNEAVEPVAVEPQALEEGAVADPTVDPVPYLTRIPRDLYGELKATAAAERRSINQQVLVYLERGLRGERRGA